MTFMQKENTLLNCASGHTWYHTVMPEWDSETGSLEYQAQSPDENALVSAARYSLTDDKLDTAVFRTPISMTKIVVADAECMWRLFLR